LLEPTKSYVLLNRTANSSSNAASCCCASTKMCTPFMSKLPTSDALPFCKAGLLESGVRQRLFEAGNAGAAEHSRNNSKSAMILVCFKSREGGNALASACAVEAAR